LVRRTPDDSDNAFLLLEGRERLVVYRVPTRDNGSGGSEFNEDEPLVVISGCRPAVADRAEAAAERLPDVVAARVDALFMGVAEALGFDRAAIDARKRERGLA
jgi:hypothetical protein